MNLQTWFENGPMKVVSKDDAALWFKNEVNLTRVATGISQEDAEEMVREYLGYASGYYSIDVARRVYDFWNAEHPFLGTPDERAKLTPDQVLAVGMAVGEIMRGKVGAKA